MDECPESLERATLIVGKTSEVIVKRSSLSSHGDAAPLRVASVDAERWHTAVALATGGTRSVKLRALRLLRRRRGGGRTLRTLRARIVQFRATRTIQFYCNCTSFQNFDGRALWTFANVATRCSRCAPAPTTPLTLRVRSRRTTPASSASGLRASACRCRRCTAASDAARGSSGGSPRLRKRPSAARAS